MAPLSALADSESGSEPYELNTPSGKELERALCDAVAKIYNSGKMEELTVKRVRTAAEKELRLEEGFYKSNGDWKSRSDQIIKDEVVCIRLKTSCGISGSFWACHRKYKMLLRRN
jgi:hypothetical protein